MFKNKLYMIIFFSLFLTSCNAFKRLENVGNPPPLQPVTTQESVAKTTQPIPYPLPKYEPQQYAANSLWRPNGRSFFKDQRANQTGDILTIDVDISGDTADFSNMTEHKREKAEEKANIANFLNFPRVTKLIDKLRDPATGKVADFDSQDAYKGSGNIKRTEKLKVKIAAIVTHILPNGNFVIHGRQQIRVNYEMRDLLISGIIRPEDITPENSISYEKIAEVRLSYGGEGHITDVQQPRYGQQIFDIFFPF